MKNIFSKLLLTFVVSSSVLAIGFAAPQAYAQDAPPDASDAVCAALGDANADSCAASGDAQVSNVIRVALNILSFAAGFIAVISLIISGLKYITSQGDSNSISSARSSVIYAIVGIAIVVLSQVIVRFVINQANTPAPPPPPATIIEPPASTGPPGALYALFSDDSYR